MRRSVPLMVVASLTLAIVGCKDSKSAPQEVGLLAENYSPEVGMSMEFVPPDQGGALPLHLVVHADTWELRQGDTWEIASPIAQWDWNLNNGLSISGQLVLPKSFTQGHSEGGVTVNTVGEYEVWYGIFPRAAAVTIDAGPLIGDAAFAEGVGPIHLTMNASTWHLAGYDPP